MVWHNSIRLVSSHSHRKGVTLLAGNTVKNAVGMTYRMADKKELYRCWYVVTPGEKGMRNGWPNKDFEENPFLETIYIYLILLE